LARRSPDLGVEIGQIRRYLRGWYNGARDMMEDAGLDVAGMDGPDAVKDALKDLADTTETTRNGPAELEGPGKGHWQENSRSGTRS
jgi:hypothetical protein